MEELPSQAEIGETYRLVATEVGGKVVDVIRETATRLDIPVSNVQEFVCGILQKQPHELGDLWIASEIDR